MPLQCLRLHQGGGSAALLSGARTMAGAVLAREREGEVCGMQSCVSATPPARAGPRDSRGAAMIETAIALPVLLMLLFGAIEFGFALYRYVVINSVAAEVARTVAVCPPTQLSCQAVAAVERGREVLKLGVMDPADFAITVTTTGDSIVVTVARTSNYTLVIPFMPSVDFPFTAESRMRKEGPLP